MKNVLYLSYDGLLEGLGQSQILPYLKKLSQEEITFHLITFEKQNRTEDTIQLLRNELSEYKIKWYPQVYHKKPPIISTVLDLRTMKKISKSILKKQSIDLIHCRSYLPAMIGRYFFKKSSIPFLFDMRGFWADERIEGNIWSLKNPVFKTIYSFFKKQEKKLLTDSAHIISLTNEGKKQLIEHFHISRLDKKTSVIPCCVDLVKFDFEKISEDKKSEIKHRLKIPESSFVLGYVGSIGTWYMLDEMLAFFKNYQNRNTNAHFMFVTPEDKRVIQEKAKHLGLDLNTLSIVSSQASEVPNYLSCFDWSIYFIRPTFSKSASSPIKQGELMSMGIPILTNAGVGDNSLFIEQLQTGILLDELSETTFENVHLSDQFNRNDLRKTAKQYFSLEKGVHQYLEVYKSIWQK
jgi:glycosyltransferase involved in cell wall biosynthesis